MATPRTSATPSISGAAVPEKILSACVRAMCARARPTHSSRCQCRGCVRGLWNARRGDAMRQIYLPGPERSRGRVDAEPFDRVGTGGRSSLAEVEEGQES